ncbi:hypothetical protein FB451DRAFT_1268961 [Mycena latifolia]|nr:hypothetical protein FB451DRAFT_1268961 [Mycena latifolia]
MPSSTLVSRVQDVPQDAPARLAAGVPFCTREARAPQCITDRRGRGRRGYRIECGVLRAPERAAGVPQRDGEARWLSNPRAAHIPSPSVSRSADWFFTPAPGCAFEDATREDRAPWMCRVRPRAAPTPHTGSAIARRVRFRNDRPETRGTSSARRCSSHPVARPVATGSDVRPTGGEGGRARRSDEHRRVPGLVLTLISASAGLISAI